MNGVIMQLQEAASCLSVYKKRNEGEKLLIVERFGLWTNILSDQVGTDSVWLHAQSSRAIVKVQLGHLIGPFVRVPVYMHGSGIKFLSN